MIPCTKGLLSLHDASFLSVGGVLRKGRPWGIGGVQVRTSLLEVYGKKGVLALVRTGWDLGSSGLASVAEF